MEPIKYWKPDKNYIGISIEDYARIVRPVVLYWQKRVERLEKENKRLRTKVLQPREGCGFTVADKTCECCGRKYEVFHPATIKRRKFCSRRCATRGRSIK